MEPAVTMDWHVSFLNEVPWEWCKLQQPAYSEVFEGSV